VLYFFDERRTAILLHGFTKDTALVTESDKQIGIERMARHEMRLGGESPTTGKLEPAKGGKRK
jgi:phage-related protein